MQSSNRGYSLVQDYGTYSSSCGYCHDEAGVSSSAHGMHAYRLTVQDYQELLDQGWRRSGKYLYKPDNKVTCCRQYTIRLDVKEYRPSKSHKKLLRTWEKFLAGHLQQDPQQQVGEDGDTDMADAKHQQLPFSQPLVAAAAAATAAQSAPSAAASGASSAWERSSKRSKFSGDNNRNNDSQTAEQQGQAAIAARTCSHAVSKGTTSGPEQQAASAMPKQQHLVDSLDQLAQTVQQMLQQVVPDLSQQGLVPQQELPPVKVTVPPQQKLQKLPSGTLMTSSCAHALAAAARRWQRHKQQQQQQQQQQHSTQRQQGNGNFAGAVTIQQEGTAVNRTLCCSADQLAQVLAEQFNALAAANAVAGQVSAAAVQGHINFAVRHNQRQQQPNGQQPQQPQQPAQPGQRQQQGRLQRPQQEHRQQSPRLEQQQGQQQQQQHQTVQQHQLEIRMVPNQFIQEEYELYCKYQMQQHNDEPEELTPKRYKNFLVDTPLIPVMPPEQQQQRRQQQQQGPAPGNAGLSSSSSCSDAVAAVYGAVGGMPACGYGSFHQQYWLDHKLIAVGVVDVLPRCLSSKYFFWDPEYSWLSLGRFGALQEIKWTQAAYAAGASQLCYYYMGYYIHTCPKMAYKAEYAPSELLCPERQVWVRINPTVLQAFDAAPYVVLSNLTGIQVKPNLSVSKPMLQAAANATAQQGPQQQQQPDPQQMLDAQVLFLLKQPVRWGTLKESGVLAKEQVSVIEERLASWQAVVGETASHLLYAAPSDLLP